MFFLLVALGLYSLETKEKKKNRTKANTRKYSTFYMFYWSDTFSVDDCTKRESSSSGEPQQQQQQKKKLNKRRQN